MMVRGIVAASAVAFLAASSLTGCSADEDGAATGDGQVATNTGSADVPTEGSESGSPTVEVTTPDPSGTPNQAPSAQPPRETKEPVAVEAPADFGNGVSARIAGTKGVRMTDVMPGEIAGPAVAVTVEFVNNSDKSWQVQDIVSLNYDGQEANEFMGDPAKPAPDTLEPGQTATGVYVFGVPEDKRQNVTIRVGYSPDAPQIQFTGPIG